MVAVCCLEVGDALAVWEQAPELHGVDLLEYRSVEELLAHHAATDKECLVVVLGQDVEAPERVAQRLHMGDAQLAILILSPPERLEMLALRIQRTPFIGTSTTLRTVLDPREVVPALSDAIEIARRQRSWEAGVERLREDQRAIAPALPRAQRTLDVLLERAPIGVVQLDAHGRVTSHNRAAGRILGLDGPRAPASLLELFPRSDHATLRALLPAPGTPPTGATEIELSPLHDPERVVRLQAAALDAFDTGQGLLVLAEDITERRELQARLLQAHKMESVGRLAGGIAHDFNNLLTVILGYSDQLEQALDPDAPNQRAAAQIRFAAERAAALTSQLLTFARRRPFDPVLLDPRLEIEFGARLLRDLVGPRVRLELEFEPDLPRIRIDAGQFQQLLMNLAVNARDAMPDGGRLGVRARGVPADVLERTAAGERALEIEVSDTGDGMDEETLSHLFEPVFTTKEVGRGTGLGLATCHGIVEQAGGRMRVESRPGQGSRFTIHLPEARPDDPA